MKKVLIVGYSPLCQKQNVILGIDKLSEITSVEYWDLSLIFGDQARLPKITIKSVLVKEVNSLRQFEALVKNISDEFVIFYMHLDNRTYPYYKALSLTKCKLANIVTGSLPSCSSETCASSFFDKMTRCLKEPKKLGHFFLVKVNNIIFSLKVKSLRPFDYCLFSGLKPSLLFNCDNVKMVPINDYDYQITKDTPKEKLVEGHYILFIDQYEPFHPDFEILGIEKVDPDSYFREINSYFDLIEKRYNMPIVISAHPKALRYHNKNYFNGRKVTWGNTCQLSYYADYVITHYSTAISFPVCFKKPLLFIYTGEMESKNPSINVLHSMANILNCNRVNISESRNTDFADVDEHKYFDYLFSYITNKESMNNDNYKIILDLLK